MPKKSDYGIDSIDYLEGPQTIRTRPASMLGSNGLDGAKHTFLEIIGNAFDECSSGYGDKIEITYHEDGSISVRDYGRGVPLGWSERKQKFGWDMIYNMLYGGGKFNNNQEILRQIDEKDAWDSFSFKDYSYLASVGLNGVGAACTQFTSEYMTVISYRDGEKSEMRFEKGYPILDELEVSPQGNEPNGTFVHWKPDSEVFTDANIPFKWIHETVKSANFITGMDVTVTNKKDGKVYNYNSQTLEEHVASLTSSGIGISKELYHEVDKEGEVVVCEANVALFEEGFGNTLISNQIPVKGGTHDSNLTSAVYYFLRDKIKEDYDLKITYADSLGGYSAIVTTLASKMSPRGQTKDSLDDEYIGVAIQIATTTALANAYFRGDAWVKKLVENVVFKAQLRLASKEKEKELKEAAKVIARKDTPDKLVSCRAYAQGRYKEVELFLVEGDSAKGPVVAGRDSEYQMILPMRGKGKNVMKATVAESLNNRESQDLINVVGAGISARSEGYDMFDMSKAKVGKIIILSDADIDGKHIQMLTLTKIYKFLAPFIEEGRVYVANAPKYKHKGKFYYSDEEFREAQERGEITGHFERFKGLGQMEPQDLRTTVLDPMTRNLTRIKFDVDDPEVIHTFDTLAGKDASSRKRMMIEELMGYDTYTDILETMDATFRGIDVEDSLNHEVIHYA